MAKNNDFQIQVLLEESEKRTDVVDQDAVKNEEQKFLHGLYFDGQAFFVQGKPIPETYFTDTEFGGVIIVVIIHMPVTIAYEKVGLTIAVNIRKKWFYTARGGDLQINRTKEIGWPQLHAELGRGSCAIVLKIHYRTIAHTYGDINRIRLWRILCPIEPQNTKIALQ